jgi:hypothetical protein
VQEKTKTTQKQEKRIAVEKLLKTVPRQRYPIAVTRTVENIGETLSRQRNNTT